MFTIGEFARFGGISVRMLRHYDEVGLLKPARVDDVTGYRHYSAHQLPDLNRLVALRTLGFGLAEIERMLDDITADELREMLRLRQSQLQAEIGEQRVQLAGVEARLRLIEKEGQMPELDIVTKSLPAERFIALSAHAPGFGPASLTDVVRQLFDELIQVISDGGLVTESPAFCFFTDDEDDSRRRVYAAIPVDDAISTVPSPAQLLVLPAVELVATAVWEGRMADYYPYGEMARWLEDHGLEQVGAGHGTGFIQLETDDSPAIIEIHWPVTGPGGTIPDIQPVVLG